jgi:hypothetical protein
MATPAESRPSGSLGPTKRVGYEVLKECHRRAYAYLTEALRIDESGEGESKEAFSPRHPLPDWSPSPDLGIVWISVE